MIHRLPLPVLLVFLAAIAGAGCVEDAPRAPSSSELAPQDADATPELPSPPSPVTLVVDAPVPTQGDLLHLTGSVDQPARLQVHVTDATGAVQSLGQPLDALAGAWALDVPIVPGRSNLTVTADTGRATAQATVQAIRLLSATLEVLYTAAFPPHAAVADLVWYDPDGHASAPLYADRSMGHPPYATVHDLMVSWQEASGTDIEYSYFDGLGFSPDKIDGVGQPLTSAAPPYWCYKLNDATADFGISLQEVAAGDTVTWEYGPCA